MNDVSHCPTDGAIGLLALLIASGRSAEAQLDDALASAGLTFVKWRALDTLIKSSEPEPLCALAGKLFCVKSNVTQLVDKLEAEGLVERIPDPEDRRSTQVRLTEVGANAHGTGLCALRSATEAVFAPMSAAQTDALRSLLNLLVGPRHRA